MITAATMPCSGWLNKLSTNNTFGTSRWQSRYFVLLDTELRYYKDEHAVHASRTIDLHDIAKVIKLSITNRKYCFKLEPTLYYQHYHPSSATTKKVWTIECPSEHELDSWVTAIETRLSNLCSDLQHFSTLELKRQQTPSLSNINMSHTTTTTTTTTTTLSAGSDVVAVKHHTLSHVPRPLNRSRPTISRRRGLILSALDTYTLPTLESSSSGTISSASSLDSNTTTQSLDDESDEEEEQISCQQQADIVYAQNAYLLNTRPTFAIYKTRVIS
ncbi:hypothetical protein BD770DRAFT_389504 [Pilaira anomala]|nr:hypothetical protein BD770DRAFT_389504 [Pilaira anomala]